MIILQAFLAGGLLCTIAHLVFTKLKVPVPALLTVFVCLGGILTALGWMDALVGFGGGGVVVTIMDAGEAMFWGIMAAFSGDFSTIIGFCCLVLFCLIIGVTAGIIIYKKQGKSEVVSECKD